MLENNFIHFWLVFVLVFVEIVKMIIAKHKNLKFYLRFLTESDFKKPVMY